MSDLAEILRGRFIVLDGPDGAGKTTQLAMLADHLAAAGAEVERVHDPGATAVGEKIRAILLDRANGDIAPMCEMMLFMASRAQLVAERVRPALAAGKVVLCDRFISATVAYQGALGLSAATIIKVGGVAVEGVWPDLTILLDLPPEEGMQRIAVPRERLKKGRDVAGGTMPLFGDRLEVRGSEYHRSVRHHFRGLRKPGAYRGIVAVVDAARDKQAVFQEIVGLLRRKLGPEPDG